MNYETETFQASHFDGKDDFVGRVCVDDFAIEWARKKCSIALIIPWKCNKVNQVLLH